jgi:VIT1/CCC1 family predicted Fe2+/Mn2+ transporter
MPDAKPTTAAHLETARLRGRGMIAAEAAGGQPYEVLHAASAARDGAILMLALWAMLQGAGRADLISPLLLAAAVVIGLYGGIANALAVAAQLRHWAHELNRERAEIRDSPGEEREELRAIYEAKGFAGPQLDSIIDTLCSDDDRLLRVMMEEEMGIFFEQWNHPAVIGAITGAASIAGGLAVAAAAMVSPACAPIATVAIILALAAMIRTGWTRPATVESFARWTLVAGVVGGTAFFLSQLIVN